MFIEPTVDALRSALPDRQIDRYLGKGTFKAAYAGAGPHAHEALKIFYVPPFPRDAEGDASKLAFLGRFDREIRLLANCRSPYIVKLGSYAVRDVTVGGLSFKAYSEELLSGPTLSQLVGAGVRPSEAEVRMLLSNGVDAIEELWNTHRAVHRDIKPANIVLADNPFRFVLLDLGITFEMTGTRYTGGAISPATTYYAAPEILDQNYASLIDARTDLYGLAISVFEYASGAHPLGTPNRATIEAWVANTAPQRLETLRPDLTPALCGLINRLLRKHPALRGNIQTVKRELSRL